MARTIVEKVNEAIGDPVMIPKTDKGAIKTYKDSKFLAGKDSTKTDREAIKDSYEKYYKDAQKDGKTSQVSHDFYQWEEEGQVLIGKLIEFEAIDSKEYEGKYNRYIFDTDEGLMGVICGTVVDKLMAEQNLIGKVLRIEYQGQRQLDAGRTVNRFRIDIIK